MAGYTGTNSADFDASGIGAAARGSDTADEVLGPIVAGAFARGLAEAFDLLGVAGLFFARDGRVLFASKPAEACLGPGLALQGGHLLADAAEDNVRLAAFVADALRAPADCPAITLGASGLTLTPRVVPGCARSADQVLRVIVVLSRADGREG